MIKKTFKELLNIDDDDYKIIEMIEKDPDITHSQIAIEVEKSQPAIGARIIKLERKNLLTKQVGFNIKKVDIKVAIAFISTKDVEAVVKKIRIVLLLIMLLKFLVNLIYYALYLLQISKQLKD